MTEHPAHAWVRAWATGWRDHDTAPIAALYADEAVFVSEPFREPRRGGRGAGEYAAWAFADEEAVELWFASPVVDGDRAAVAYWANIRERGGDDVTLAGVSTLWFDGAGRVVQQRDYWNTSAGAMPPPDGWGPFAAHECRGNLTDASRIVRPRQ